MNAVDVWTIGISTLIGYAFGYAQGTRRRARWLATARAFRHFQEKARRRRRNEPPPG